MKFRMMTIEHDVYDEATAVLGDYKVVAASYEGGYWKLLLVDEPEPPDGLLSEHLAFFGLPKGAGTL